MSDSIVTPVLATTALTAGTSAEGSRFWQWHGWLPMGLFVPIAGLLASTDLDRRIERAWAFDAASDSFPARHAYWAEYLLHRHGRDFVWLIVVSCVALLVLSAFRPALRVVRRRTVYVIVAIGVTTALIGLLKQMTQVHCPWELRGFGGESLYVPLFSARVDLSDPGACFPGAHSGSGFALFALYFALRDYSSRWARLALLAALGVGCIFAFAQEARGAHFLSHDLWSAAIAWTACLGLYLALLAPARNTMIAHMPG